MTMRMEAGSALWRVVLLFRSLKNCRLSVAQPLQFSVSPAGCKGSSDQPSAIMLHVLHSKASEDGFNLKMSIYKN